jgi:hypothetical protein
MKKILFLATFLIGLFASAQQSSADIIMAGVKQRDAERAALQKQKDDKAAVFNHPNKDYILSLSKLDEPGAREFAENVAANGKTKWEFLKILESTKQRLYIIVFIDASATEEMKAIARKSDDYSGQNHLDVSFTVYYEGENPSLEIAGTKKFKFNNVSGKYLDLFPIWKKVFRPDVELEKTIDDFSSQELRHRPQGIIFKIQNKQDNLWELSNWSN